MPRFRPEIAALKPYQVGRQLADVARAHGLEPSEIVKLTANEGPEGPFPGVVEAVAKMLGTSNRYPDNDCWDLGHELAAELGVDFSNLMFGAGSVALISDMISATGGPGTNVVYGWPSFIMYRFASIWSGTDYREIPVDDRHRIDLEAMRDAVDSQTRVVVVCNPNNPTGTIRSGDDIEAFIESLPEDVLVVVDEAYHEYVTDQAYRSLLPWAQERPNVLVLRTFSKIFALAAYRVGYAIGHPDTLTELRKAQAPLTVNQLGQVAARASLGQPGELERRQRENSARRHHLSGALRERGIEVADSQTNFVYFELGEGTAELVEQMTAQGVLIRPMSETSVRVTIGDDAENERFLEAFDSAIARV